MPTTHFVNDTTVIMAEWLNEVDASTFTAVPANSAFIAAISTSTVPEASNLYWTQARFNTAYAAVSSLPELVVVKGLADLPAASSGVITLAANVTYLVVKAINLAGARLVAGANTVLIGESSENCSITSSGLANDVPLLTARATIVVRHITFRDVHTGIFIDDNSGAGAPLALDWFGVNFLNVPNVGEIGDADNFIYSTGAFLNSKNLRLTGTIGTVSLSHSLFSGDGAAGSLIEITASATITRRFRIIYSALIAASSTVGLTVSASASIPVESYILKNVNFDGGGTYLAGVGVNDNKTLFEDNVGIDNTAVNGQLYMRGNAVATVVSAPATFYRIAGTSIASADNAKFAVTDGRLTCNAVIPRKYLVQATLSFNSGNNDVCEFGFYDSTITAVRVPSITRATANAAGRAESVSVACIVTLKAGDYLEAMCANTGDTANITVSELNFLAFEI